MDLSLRSIKPNYWSANSFNKKIISMICTRYSHVTVVSGCPFWQLPIDHDMDVYKDVHYQFKYLDTYLVMPGHYKKIMSA